MEKTKWIIDPAHSLIGFSVKHMMFTNVSGKFEKFNAQVESENNNFSDARFHFTAEISSINTGNNERDNHLKGVDFFDSDVYPSIEFSSTSMKKISEEKFELSGVLTLRGVSKNILLDAEYSGSMTDPWGNKKAAFTLNGVINRKDWGLNWNAALEAGGVLVSEDVKLNIEIQLIQQ